MKAIVWTRYGPPEALQVEEVGKPVPRAGEVLVRVRAATAFPGDCEIRRLDLPWYLAGVIRLMVGLRRPRRAIVLGQEVAGEVEAIGEGVETFAVGDALFGATDGLWFGAYAEYVRLPADGPRARKPDCLSFEEAAAVPVGGLNALHFMRAAAIQPGEHVLINGAGGCIGTFAVQLAKHYGAEVTAVDHTDKLDTLRSLGADHVVDYTRENALAPGARYDVIFDVIGHALYSRCIEALRPNGRLLLVQVELGNVLRGRWTAATSDKRVICEAAPLLQADLLELTALIEEGVVRPVIDRSFPLEQAAEAHRFVETGRKCGHVVLTVGTPGPD